MAAGWLMPGKVDAGFLWLPWMISPYMGTPKAFALYATFGIFGISLDTLRLTTILFGAAAVSILTAGAIQLYGRFLGWVFGLWIATDPTFLLSAAYDTVPAANPVRQDE